MSYLAVKVSEFLERSPLTARQLEDRANLPRMTIGTIVKDGHPRPDRFGQLLRAVDDATARDWLEAYLLDDCPESWLPRVKILIEGLHLIPTDTNSSTLNEPTKTYGHSIDPTARARRAIQRLEAVMARDTTTAAWFVQTIDLILGPEDIANQKPTQDL